MKTYQWLLCAPWIIWVVYLCCVLIHELRSESQREAAGTADEKPDGQAENARSHATGANE